MNIPKKLITQAIDLYNDGASRMEVARMIMKETGLKDTAAKARAKVIWDNNFDEDYVNIQCRESYNEGVVDAFEQPESLIFSNKYIYNSDDKKYVFLTDKKLGKNLVLDESLVKRIIKLYTNFSDESHSINEISNSFSIPRNFIVEILRCLEITHDSLPITSEELYEKNEDKLVDEILQEKRFSLYQSLKKGTG